MAKIKQYIVALEQTLTYEINVEATSEEKAIKRAKQALKDGEEESCDESIEVIDIFEDYDENE